MIFNTERTFVIKPRKARSIVFRYENSEKKRIIPKRNYTTYWVAYSVLYVFYFLVVTMMFALDPRTNRCVYYRRKNVRLNR